MTTYSALIVHPKRRALTYTLNATTPTKARAEAALLIRGMGEGAILTLSRVNANGIHISVVVGMRGAKTTKWKAPAM